MWFPPSGGRSEHPYPKHLEGIEYRGLRRYFLTFCTHDRRPLFTSAERVTLVASHFLRMAFIKRMKQYTGYYYKQTFGDRLWQRYGYEHVIRDEETTAQVVRYVLENPVRAQLVSTVSEYPFIGSSEYSLEQLLDFCRDSPDHGSSA